MQTPLRKLLQKKGAILGANPRAPHTVAVRGEPVTKSLQNSHLLEYMAMGNRLTLTENKRSEPILFNWYSSLAKGGFRYTRDLCENVAEARLMFTEDNAVGFIPGTKLARINFAISHKTRIALAHGIPTLAEYTRCKT